MTTVSFRPRDGCVLGTVADSTAVQVSTTVDLATSAAPGLASARPSRRQAWLESVADALDAHRDELTRLADLETALGRTRLTGELARTAAQLRFYGRVAAEGGYLGAAIDHRTDATPRLVRINRPLGPVAVFGAGNFPFAFGMLGNDTASALAAGCPVVAKAHPAHVVTCARLAEIAEQALREAGAPPGTFGMVVGFDAGVELVGRPGVKAVGFTGSQAGGLAVWRLANERDEVIPVFAEMGTVNPVVMTPLAAASRAAEWASGFVDSFTLGDGQFCTKPGLMLAPAGHRVPRTVADALHRAGHGATMLTRGIADAVAAGLDQLRAAGAEPVGIVPGTGSGWSADAAVLAAPIDALQPGSRLLEECFGPVALVVEYDGRPELDAALARLQGSLTGTVLTGGPQDPDTAHLVATLAERVGRVTVDEWPTGVAWTWAQHHGGPWPATSAPSSTSVGAGALSRFVRPVTFQSVPDQDLPAPARAAVAVANPWAIPRRIDGVLTIP